MPSYGEIVLVEGLADPNGVNPKDRPCVVVSPDEGRAEGGPIAVVAISTLLPGPTPPDAVPLMYDPRGHRRTGLKTRCAAFARWLALVEPGRVARTIGHVPPADLLKLAGMLARIAAEGEGE